MTSPSSSIKPWLSQAEAQRLLCELSDANLDAAQRKRERDILQHALNEMAALVAELRIAVLEEREACKKIATNYEPQHEANETIARQVARNIAAEIDARPAP